MWTSVFVNIAQLMFQPQHIPYPYTSSKQIISGISFEGELHSWVPWRGNGRINGRKN
jgi:hypothetical protein